jgi:AbrB family looped-hinge helix DNA binding protein
MSQVTISAKGQIVIPAELRRRLKLKKGTKVSLTEEDGKLLMQPITADFIRSLMGIAKGYPSLVEAHQREKQKEIRREKKKERAFEKLRAGR